MDYKNKFEEQNILDGTKEMLHGKTNPAPSPWRESASIRVDSQPVQIMRFPGGELNVRIQSKFVCNARVEVEACLRDPESIVELLLAHDALRAMGAGIGELVIPYFPYARQDRVCNAGESLSVRVMADIVNSLDALKVTVYDPHSDVVCALVKNINVIEQWRFINLHILNSSKRFTIVSPDAGAEKKARILAKVTRSDLITASKVRDVATGEITSIEVHADKVPELCLIPDDICDGGGTFILLAKALRARGAKHIRLFVTHGIFSKGFDVFRGSIDHIYYTNSLWQRTDKPFNFINKWSALHEYSE